MLVNIPADTRYHWNPYCAKQYTIVASGSSEGGSSWEEDSLGLLEDEEYDLAYSMIATLRSQTTDALMLHTARRLPARTLTIVLTALEASPALLMELCEKERGNVVAQVLQVLGGDRCGEMVRFILENAYRLATNQSGCIALTRIYDNANFKQRQYLSAFAMANFRELAPHQFGNYVVQRVLQDNTFQVHAEAGYCLMEVEFLDYLAMNKFGSHVIETYMKNAPADYILSVCEVLFRDEIQVVKLAFHKIGNYTMQGALKQMLLSSDSTHPLVQWCLSALPGLVAGSQYAPNLTRALGYQSTRR